MNDLLDLLKKEKEAEQNKKFKVEHNSQLEQITRGFEKTCLWYDLIGHTKGMTNEEEFIYKLCSVNVPDNLDVDYINPNDFVSKEILPNLINSRYIISQYITALANYTKKEKVIINLTNTENLIGNNWNLDRLCHDNKKEVIIIGDVGIWCGQDMIGGSLTINGEVCFNVGKNMKKGIININCNLGREINDLIDPDYPPKGEIYYNGKLICKEGKIIE